MRLARLTGKACQKCRGGVGVGGGAALLEGEPASIQQTACFVFLLVLHFLTENQREDLRDPKLWRSESNSNLKHLQAMIIYVFFILFCPFE